MFDTELVIVTISVIIPNMHAILNQILNISITRKEPKQLVDYALQKDLLGCEQRKAFAQIKSHLMAENTLCSRTRAVTLDNAFILNSAKQIEVLFHILTMLKFQITKFNLAIGAHHSIGRMMLPFTQEEHTRLATLAQFRLVCVAKNRDIDTLSRR